VSGDFEDKTTTVEILNLESVEDGRKILSVELNIDDSTNNGLNRAYLALCLGSIGANYVDFFE
jgi:hypothetical protein